MNIRIKSSLWVLAPLAFALHCAPSFADVSDGANFNVVQATGANYVPFAPATGAIVCGAGECRTQLEPPKVISLGAGNKVNTATLAADLQAQRPAFSIDGFGGNLNIGFNITEYSAFNDGTSGGANLVVDFTKPASVVLPANLHWVQIVTDNFNLTGVNGANLAAPMGIGKQENVIDAPSSPGSPYYDVSSLAAPTPFNTNPPHFEDGSLRSEPTAADPVIVWNAELFLVSDPGTKKMTVYNGVEWGWTTEFSANGVFGAPEPATWAMMLVGFGMIGFMLQRRRGLKFA
jgi:hypothetical protein